MAVGMSLKLGFSAQVTRLLARWEYLNGGKVWVKVKQMFPAGGLDPEPKIRS